MSWLFYIRGISLKFKEVQLKLPQTNITVQYVLFLSSLKTFDIISTMFIILFFFFFNELACSLII